MDKGFPSKGARKFIKQGFHKDLRKGFPTVTQAISSPVFSAPINMCNIEQKGAICKSIKRDYLQK
jgi:hypothetical protein